MHTRYEGKSISDCAERLSFGTKATDEGLQHDRSGLLEQELLPEVRIDAAAQDVRANDDHIGL
jgi:hypothetical protein